MYNEKLVSLAHSTKNFINALAKVNKNIQELNTQETISTVNSYKNEEGQNSFIKRCIRKAFEPITCFNDKNLPHMDMVFSLLCFSQDWDTLLSSIKEIPDTLNITDVNVSSWGHIYQNYDINFLKQIRNGIAHSKFTYDFDNQHIFVNMYNNTFQADFPLNFLLSLPWSLWNLSESYTSKESIINCNILNLSFNPTFYNINVKNDSFDLSLLNKYPIFAPIDYLLYDLKDEEDTNGLAIIYKSNLFKIMLDSKLKNTYSLQLDEIHEIAKLCGLSVCDVKKVDAEKHLFNNNKFLKAFFNSQYVLLDEEKQNRLSFILSSIIDERNINFFPSVEIGELLTTIPEPSEAKKINTISNNLTPFTIDILQTYAERSYFNFVFNYIYENASLNQTKLNATLNETFNSIATNITGATTPTELIEHLRNCIVHPKRFSKINGKYELLDFDRRNNQTFSATLKVKDLMKIADKILNNTEPETKPEETIEIEK